MSSELIENYDIQKRIEKLLIWFLPVFLLTVLANTLSTTMLKTMADTFISQNESIATISNNIYITLKLLGGLDNLVIAVWLFFQARELKFNRYLWPIFGFVQSYNAVIIFIILIIFKAYKAKSSNHEINRTEDTSAT